MRVCLKEVSGKSHTLQGMGKFTTSPRKSWMYTMQIVSLKDMPSNLKSLLLKELGLGVDENGYITKDGEQVLDRYTNQPVRIENMVILPGSIGAVVLDDNPLSIASYIEEYGEV